MPNLQTYIDPISTRQLLDNFSQAIDETRLMHEIANRSKQLSLAASSDFSVKRYDYLQKEITKLEVQLNYLRDRIKLI